MYLSKLVLNPRSKQALREVDDPYQMHRTLSKAFGNMLSEARLLFRVERSEHQDPHVIAQSLVEPDWSALPVGYANATSKTFDLKLEKGRVLRFRLLARASKRDPRTRKRVTVRGDEAVKIWLERKAQHAGFEIRTLKINETRWHDTKRIERLPNGNPKPLQAVQFDGVLVVTDPDKLRQAVRNGIGPQKAYGFGLLSLAPLEE